MNLAYSTGNPIVDKVSQINVTGNVTPITWYKTLLAPGGKPYLIAIIILADIVYWYRAKETRDETTGMLVGYSKRFAADFLQRSYRQISDEFGISKKQARCALDYLEAKGVIKRHLRNETTALGQTLTNVMYIELVPEVLQELTYPSESPEISEMAEGGYLEDTTLVTSRAHGGYLEGTTYTETTTEIKDKIDEMDRTRRTVKEKIEYEYLVAEHAFDKECLDEIVELITDIIAIPRGTVIIGGAAYSYRMVKEQFLKLEGEHIRYVLESLKSTTTKITNIKGYLLTALYNAPNTIGNYYRAEVNHDMNVPSEKQLGLLDRSFFGIGNRGNSKK